MMKKQLSQCTKVIGTVVLFNLCLLHSAKALTSLPDVHETAAASNAKGVEAAPNMPSSTSGLTARDFNKYWKMEAESPQTKVTFKGDTADIVAPKGLTLWRREMMKGDVTIEYDACVINQTTTDRTSDLNCFWKASDPEASNIWKRMAWRGGNFNRSYSLQLYYMSVGGNGNTTTRFRRYVGDAAGETDASRRPAVWREYTDGAHLLQPNHWCHVRIVCQGSKVCYYLDNELLVSYNDPTPLRNGWFGFRTTQSHVRITNFSYKEKASTAGGDVPLHWIGSVPAIEKAVSFGVPFDRGDIQPGAALHLVTDKGEQVPVDTWPLAYWPDGSVKWCGVAGVVPGGSEHLRLTRTAVRKDKSSNKTKDGSLIVDQKNGSIVVSTGRVKAFFSTTDGCLLDSLQYQDLTVGRNGQLVCTTQSTPVLEQTQQVNFSHYGSKVTSVQLERQGKVRAVVKLQGVHTDGNGRDWLPFTVRFYFFAGSEQVRMVHSFVYDGDQNKDFIRALGVRFDVPMRDELYNRHVAFSCADGGVWSEPIQPLVGRRVLNNDPSLQVQQMEGKRIPAYSTFDAKARNLIDNWATWDGYRLSQLTDGAFTIRKRSQEGCPWLGTFTGTRSNGYAFVGDVSGGFGMCLHDFWQSCPSAIEVNGACTSTASITAWLWSPDAEPMDLRHYDTRAHDLNASYEDVQEGMSTPYGVARTTELTLMPQAGYAGKAAFASYASLFNTEGVLLPSVKYLHDKQAFGVWSMPDRSTPFRTNVENRLDDYVNLYVKAVEQNKWYGFWHYGDVMHAYDSVRHCWRYDIGGYAWDNTELASIMWLWYSFLRTGRADLWKMASAMARHTGEVDVYHLGPNAGLGSRHNVSHWGCGAKEARISQAEWNRFFYYLTTDERCGDLMTEVKDAEQKLYTLDPMRLAEPRSQYPCTAPARLRIGPDWLAYAGNWMTEWERTRNTAYRDKIITGMKSIVALPSQLFTGPLALGFNPATGVITSECDPKLQSTNHLMTIMGGFELMNEMMPMVDQPAWNAAWLDMCARYKEMALKINHNRFRISRLRGYAASHLRRPEMAREAWTDLFHLNEHKESQPMRVNHLLPPDVPAECDECTTISTNDASTWSLDAIYLLEACPMDDLMEQPK